MDQVNQENELQKAIDNITQNGGLSDAPADAAAELEAKIQDQMGTPPVPPMPPAGDGPDGALPPTDDAAQAAPAEPADATPEMEIPQIMGSGSEIPAPEAPATPEVAAPEVAVPAEPSMEVTPNIGGDADINTVKEAMLRDLFPLMDKVDMAAEEKFDLYKTMIDSSNDKSMISAAYEAAKGIADEKQKAEALLFLIRKADA